MSANFKLICETPDAMQPLELISEQKSLNSEGTLYVQGPYMGGGVVNKNNRLYPIEEMRREVNNFIQTKVATKQALGELNHPTHADIDLDRAAHLIVEMWEDNNTWYGKSKVLTGTPKGDLLKSLLENGVAIGMSSRCLGQLMTESGRPYSVVQNMKMVTVDAVSDPSFDKAFVNGILESKQFVCTSDETYVEKYDKFDSALNNLPKANKCKAIEDAVTEFMKSFNN